MKDTPIYQQVFSKLLDLKNAFYVSAGVLSIPFVEEVQFPTSVNHWFGLSHASFALSLLKALSVAFLNKSLSQLVLDARHACSIGFHPPVLVVYLELQISFFTH